MSQARIASLHIYPVKSLKGVSLESAKALHSGLEGDRQWGIFKEDGHPLTQRKYPRMALISPSLKDGKLYLSAPSMEDLCVESPSSEETSHTFKVWKDDCAGQYTTQEANLWLSEALEYKEPLKLAKANPQHTRSFIAPERFGVNANYFSDAAPYLITNTASITKLNEALNTQSLTTVDMRHFRPNIVLESNDLPAFDEHKLQQISSQEGEFHFQCIDACQRCVMITVNPDTGEYLAKASPFKTLTQLNPMPDSPKAPAFGVNATFHTKTSHTDTHPYNQSYVQLKVGQTLELG